MISGGNALAVAMLLPIVATMLLALSSVSTTAAAATATATAYANSGGAQLVVDGSKVQPMPKTLFGVFFEEINHAGDGGLWAELVSNRGFEAGGRHSPSWIEPWDMVGDDDKIILSTELNSCFENNKAALKMNVLCDKKNCPDGGVGVYNPGFLGMNIQQGKTYNIIFYVRSDKRLDLTVSFASADGSKILGSTKLNGTAKRWTKMDLTLIPQATDTNARIQLTSTTKGTVWIDQVSAMPADTYKGHGFRSDLFQMVLDLKPAFLRFPGGNYVEGDALPNAFRWKETIGAWEERPGHLNDAWNYWANDGLGYLEYLQMAEDLGAEPVWVFNNGVSLKNTVNVSLLQPFIQEMLDSIEFANGDPNTQWGSVRAKMGHPAPFNIKYVAIGNEECWKPQYRANYVRFYDALKKVYPSIKVISNCDASSKPLDHPADLYDYHVYTTPQSMFSLTNHFNNQPRNGPKAFVSEYAVTDPGTQNDNGTLIAALSEAAFLMGIEKNSDVVEMASYAPLFGLLKACQWKPDAIFFNSFQAYGIPSYWMQMFFKESNGANLLYSNFTTNSQQQPLVASVISYQNTHESKNYIRIKIVNMFANPANVTVTMEGIINPAAELKGASQTIMSGNPYDENSVAEPLKISPKTTSFEQSGNVLNINLPPYSLIAVDLLNQ